MSSTLLFIIIGIIMIVSIMVLNGFKTRCPNCGSYKLHPKDKMQDYETQKVYELSREVGLDVFTDKPSYATANFVCSTCSHHFSRKTALTWLEIFNKLGDDIAIKEYRKLRI